MRFIRHVIFYRIHTNYVVLRIENVQQRHLLYFNMSCNDVFNKILASKHANTDAQPFVSLHFVTSLCHFTSSLHFVTALCHVRHSVVTSHSFAMMKLFDALRSSFVLLLRFLPVESIVSDQDVPQMLPLEVIEDKSMTVIQNTSPISLAELERERDMPNVTVCAVVKNEELYIDEWLTYHKFLGFDRVHLHDNADNASNYIADLPKKYGNFIKVSHSPGLGMQISSYARCVTEEGANSNTWTAFIDIDEFIVLRKHPSIKAFLQDVAPDGGSVVLNWSIMGSSGALIYEPAPVVSRFILTSAAPNPHVKTIAYLPHVLHPHIHNCYMKPGHPSVDQHGRAVNPDSPFHSRNDRETAHINHYYTKSWEEFKLKKHRGFASNYMQNHLFEDESEEALKRIARDFNRHNLGANQVSDTVARDFYLSHLQPV